MYSKIVYLLLLLPGFLCSQVGINTTSPKEGAILDISSTDKGLFIPKVDITATHTIDPITGITNLIAAEGLFVYNTNTTTGPGFFFWDGSEWISMRDTSLGDTWNIGGNAGTTAGTNYVGTSDAEDLYLSTNGTDKMRILSDGRIAINGAPYYSGDKFTVTSDIFEYAINSYSNGGAAIWAEDSGGGDGVLSFTTNNGWSVYGNNTGTGLGVYGVATNSGQGLRGYNNSIGEAIGANNNGTGRAILATSTSNTTIQAQNSISGYGIASFSQTAGIYNQVSSGYGQYNSIESNSFGVVTELIAAGGTGEIVDLGVQDGTGYLAVGADSSITPTNGGNIYGFDSIVYTKDPSSSSGMVNGSAYAGEQNGVGHGFLLNHSGSEGRNAEFNITNTSNPDPAIFSVHEGSGAVIIGQNHNNSITGTISVADFAYSGTDIDDHIAISGYSNPSGGWGVGVSGYGGFYGVYGESTIAGYALFGNGDTGATGIKSFVIDHPDDPSRKILKHFSVESNEVLNLYRGTEEFDALGRAKVVLPKYYNAINMDPSYQLTAIGASMPNLHILKELDEEGVFIIAGGVPEKKVSWMVTSQRNDPYLKAHPEKRMTVIDKGEKSGNYLAPALYNQPKENGYINKEYDKLPVSKINKRARNKWDSEKNKRIQPTLVLSTFEDTHTKQKNQKKFENKN